MNCEIQHFKGRGRNADTLPPQGKVKEVRKEWLVHEDGALAYRLQDEEFRHHLSGNKSRNGQIREDLPCAKQEQRKEAEEARRIHQLWLQQQEEEDARIANEVAARLEREDTERLRQLEERDKALAAHLQEKEQTRRERRERRDLEVHTPRKEKLQSYHQSSSPQPRSLYGRSGELPESSVDGDIPVPGPSSGLYDDNLDAINNVGLPSQNDLSRPMRSCRLYSAGSRDSRETPSPPPMSEDEARKVQEEKDAELARRLQEEEEEAVDPLTRDRLLAIETQDKELARLLQEKEKVRLRRAKERARARAAARRAAEMEELEDGQHGDSAGPAIRPKPRYPDPDEIVSIPEPLDNIAIMIDPTYPAAVCRMPPTANQSQNLIQAATPEPESPTDGAAPPYMPIQGQRRFNEKKPKTKDGCKQQ